MIIRRSLADRSWTAGFGKWRPATKNGQNWARSTQAAIVRRTTTGLVPSMRAIASDVIGHLTNTQVTPERLPPVDRSDRGNARLYGHRERHQAHASAELPNRAICTLARPDAKFDMSVLRERSQWLRDGHLFDLMPDGRLQTRKYRAVVPACALLESWLAETDDRLVCNESVMLGEQDEPWLLQRPVASVKKAWTAMRPLFGIPPSYGPKLFRHSMATILANKRVPSQEISLALGHKTLPASTKAYVIYDPAYLSGLRDGLEAVTSEIAQKANIPLHAKRTQVGADGRRRRE